MTLPLIYLLNNSGFGEKRKIVNIVKNHNNNPEKVASVIKKVNQSGGIEYNLLIIGSSIPLILIGGGSWSVWDV